MILNNLRITDDKGNFIKYGIEYNDGVYIRILKESILKNTGYIVFDIPFFENEAGDEGDYVVSDIGRNGSGICFFDNKEDYDVTYSQDLMPVIGVKKKEFIQKHEFFSDGKRRVTYSDGTVIEV